MIVERTTASMTREASVASAVRDRISLFIYVGWFFSSISLFSSPTLPPPHIIHARQEIFLLCYCKTPLSPHTFVYFTICPK